MRAVLLAAGRGKRLASDAPKCLLDVGGRTLLARHIDNMHRAGVDAVTVVVGHQENMIRSFVAEHLAHTPLTIELVTNPDFVRGSIVSLYRAADRLRDGGIYMDADVLYPPALLERLVRSPHENAVLLDGRSEETGEEMMVGTINGRVMAIARRVSPLGTWDFAGESVGFAKVGKKGWAVLESILAEEIAAGRLDQEYEAAMNRAFSLVEWGFERVDEFPWTEIDFREDVERASELVKVVDAASA
ncbi:MAG: phosphocholine cytidylyltransferase family protein [Polyangiaceae bacterium]